MKLATLKNGTRDGKLVVVSRDLTRFTDASFLTPTLQAALDDWRRIFPHLAAMAESLETGAVPSSRFHEHDAQSPLPRAYAWLGGSGALVPPRDPILARETVGVEAGVAVIVDDVPQGSSIEDAHNAIRLVLLASAAVLPNVAGKDDFQGRPTAAFSPVAVTPDELGDDWNGASLNLPLHLDVNGKPSGHAIEKTNFSAVITHAARTRSLIAGTIVSGSGETKTPSLNTGDTVRVEMKDKGGHSIFGAIEQRVEKG